MIKVNKKRFQEIYQNFKGKRIAVVGDLMLDRYFWGSVSRISPEAPVPVIDIKKEHYHLGGAANVSANLVSLGIDVLQCGMVGADEMGYKLVKISEDLGIDCSGIYKDDERPTTVKTRVFGNNQQIVRLDNESTSTISNNGERFILDVLYNTKDIAGLVFADYNKGLITDIIIREIAKASRENDIPIFVDPKFTNFFEYSNVKLFKPNRKEAETALKYKLEDKDSILKAGRDLLSKVHADNILLTLGSDGMLLFDNSGNVSSISTRARQVADVSGAGDTAIATFAASYIGGASIGESAFLSNVGAGYVCEIPGIVSVKVEDILGEL